MTMMVVGVINMLLVYLFFVDLDEITSHNLLRFIIIFLIFTAFQNYLFGLTTQFVVDHKSRFYNA